MDTLIPHGEDEEYNWDQYYNNYHWKAWHMRVESNMQLDVPAPAATANATSARDKLASRVLPEFFVHNIMNKINLLII